jgi:hypothetical protein
MNAKEDKDHRPLMTRNMRKSQANDAMTAGQVGRVCPQRAAELFGRPTGAVRTPRPTTHRPVNPPLLFALIRVFRGQLLSP